VSYRRSADGTCGVDDGNAASAGALDAPIVSIAPQSPQNILPDGFAAPHAVQRIGRRAPQSPQNFFPSGLTLPQIEQSMPTPNLQRTAA
jgi:hypothetical protein